MKSSTERQANLARRRRERGDKRIALWIPGGTHEKLTREAAARGITMNQHIIEKLDRDMSRALFGIPGRRQDYQETVSLFHALGDPALLTTEQRLKAYRAAYSNSLKPTTKHPGMWQQAAMRMLTYTGSD